MTLIGFYFSNYTVEIKCYTITRYSRRSNEIIVYNKAKYIEFMNHIK